MSEGGGSRFQMHVAMAFGGQPSAISEELLRELRSSWGAVLSRMRRLTFVMVTLIALFVLLEGANVAAISFAGVKLEPSAIKLISIAIPAVVAYLSAECWGLIAMADRYQELHDEICDQLYPNLGPLRIALHPPGTDSLGGYLFLAMGGSSMRGEMQTVLTSAVTWLVTLIAPLLFLAISYALLISDSDINRIALVVSLAFSLLCVVRTTGFARIGGLTPSSTSESDS